jgi:4-diphosphocytidyl-2-C-methyl-D-erythritol kinase
LTLEENLVLRAARRVLETSGARGTLELRLQKRIPMGAGLGGGSSDAAAVLLALPVLTGRPIPLERLSLIAQELGSDVPFFLLGGAAVGIGRGAELFPLPDGPARQGLLIAPSIHVSTADAYRALSARLTSESQENKIFSFQSNTWELVGSAVLPAAVNDFETVVFEQHRRLAKLKKGLLRAGAAQAMMTGSGSALFGLFAGDAALGRAQQLLEDETTFRFFLVNRTRYRTLWRRALAPHINGNLWPPRSRYME